MAATRCGSLQTPRVAAGSPQQQPAAVTPSSGGFQGPVRCEDNRKHDRAHRCPVAEAAHRKPGDRDGCGILTGATGRDSAPAGRRRGNTRPQRDERRGKSPGQQKAGSGKGSEPGEGAEESPRRHSSCERGRQYGSGGGEPREQRGRGPARPGPPGAAPSAPPGPDGVSPSSRSSTPSSAAHTEPPGSGAELKMASMRNRLGTRSATSSPDRSRGPSRSHGSCGGPGAAIPRRGEKPPAPPACSRAEGRPRGEQGSPASRYRPAPAAARPGQAPRRAAAASMFPLRSLRGAGPGRAARRGRGASQCAAPPPLPPPPPESPGPGVSAGPGCGGLASALRGLGGRAWGKPGCRDISDK